MAPLFPADPGVIPALLEPRAPSEEVSQVNAEPRSIEVPPVAPALPASVGVAVADIPARMVTGNGVLVESDGLNYRLGIDIEGLQIGQGQPAEQWVPVWAVGSPVDEIVRVPVNVLRLDAPSDSTVYGRYNGTWAHLTVSWGDIIGIPVTFPPSAHTHPQDQIINLVGDLALKAPLADPVLTGTPTAPLAAPGTSTFQLATTSFVTTAANLKANLAGGNTFTGGNQTISGGFGLVLTATAGTARSVSLQTAGSNRWIFGTDAAVEGGSNSGANFSLARYTDAGAFIDTPFSITRANGVAAFSFPPTWPTPAQADNTNRGATTSYVDIGLGFKANLASPALTGTPTAPTAAPGTNTTQLATTAFTAALGALKADLASPALTGTPTAPTAAPGVSTTQLATTAFVAALGALKADLASPTFTGDPKAPTPATADNDTSIATTAFVKAQAYATLASPVLTGDPQAPTATAGDSDTSVATTAFVTGGIATSAALKVAKAGDTMTGELILPAGVAGAGSVRVPHGIAPTTPVNGDMWTTSAGLYVRAGGVTTGPLGPSTGLGGLSTGEYTYFAGVAPPASGQVRMNNADPALATAIYLHYQNAVSVDIANALRLIDTGTRILVQDKDDSTKFEYYLTTAAAVDNTTYFTLAVTRTSGSVTPPATNSRVMVCVFGLGVTGYLPVSGGTMVGKLVTAVPATGAAGLNLPPGAAPSAPVNGDAWTTATALFVRINGATLTLATNVDLALKADLASPALTGNPTAPTQVALDSSTKLATTAFVTTADNLKADLASPALTGVPTAPTAAAATNTTQVATTAFVATAVASGGIDLTPYLQKAGGTMTGLLSLSGGVSGAQGGQFDITKPASGTTLAGTAVRVDINANSLRIYENATGFRGCTLDLTACGSQSAFWHSGNFNPATKMPIAGSGVSQNITVGDVTASRGDASGVIFFGNQSLGNRYLYADVSGTYQMPTGALVVGGNISAFGSDIRLKKNLRPICRSALVAVKKLRGVRFEWDEDGPQPFRGTEVGLIAQDVQAVLPEAVTLAPFDIDMSPEGGTGGSKSGQNYLTIRSEQQVIALLVEAINEMQERLDLLEATV